MHDKIGLLHLKASVGQLHMYGTRAKSQRAETYEWLEEKGFVYEAQVPERPTDEEVALFIRKAQEQHSMLCLLYTSNGLKAYGSLGDSRVRRRRRQMSSTSR